MLRSLFLLFLLPFASASCTGGVFTSAAAAEAGLAGCTTVTGNVELRFAADSTMAAQEHVQVISGKLHFQVDSSNLLRDNVCTVFPNIVSVNRLQLRGALLSDGFVVDVNCPALTVTTEINVIQVAMQQLVIANTPPTLVLRFMDLHEWVMGDFRPADGLTVLQDMHGVTVQTVGDTANYALGGAVDHLDITFRENSNGIVYVYGWTGVTRMTYRFPNQSPSTKRFLVAACSALESLAVIGEKQSKIELGVVNNAALKVLSAKAWAFAPEYDWRAIRVSGNDVLEVLRLQGTADGPVNVMYTGSDLCCDDLDQPLLRKYKGHFQCSTETCSTCAGIPELVGRNCLPCECEDNRCIDVGQRRGSPTICDDRSLEVTEAARESLCLSGRSIVSDGELTGGTLTVGSVNVASEFVLTPTTIGQCTAAKDGQLSVDVASGLLVECVARLSGWLPAGTSDGEDDVLFRLNMQDGVYGVNQTWHGTVVGASGGFVRDRCGAARGAWASNGGRAASNHVRLPGSKLFGLNLLGSVTWTGWVRVDGLSGAAVMPVFAAGRVDAGLRVGVVGTGGSVGVVEARVGTTTVQSTNALTIGQWHHVVLVHNVAAGRVQIFVDGQLEKAVAESSLARLDGIGATDAWLGRDAASVSSDFDGAIDDVVVYGTALSPALIAVLAKQPCA